MVTRRRFTADFKARVALEALRGDKTIQEIATKHKVHPNQVSTWKRQAIDGLGDVFSGGADRARSDHGSEIKELHAKIGELTVVNDFSRRGWRWSAAGRQGSRRLRRSTRFIRTK